ncbi:MAG TPA: hypothetical protein PLA50_15105 [Bacteroidia bacterium]|nr:hypothetical protein [Bacteroidia bacterium]
MTEESGGGIERGGVELAVVEDDPAHRLGSGKLAAVGPATLAFVAEDAPSEDGVLRLGQGRTRDPVFAGTGVERSTADREGGDGVRSIRCAAVDPAAVVVAVDSTSLPCPRLAGAGVECPFVNGQGEGEEGVARLAAVGPAGIATVVDAELEMPPVRLVRDHARIALEREMEAAALRRIVLAREVAARPVTRVEPERKAEVALAEARSLVRGDFHDRVY